MKNSLKGKPCADSKALESTIKKANVKGNNFFQPKFNKKS
jgi:hypothetical protein